MMTNSSTSHLTSGRLLASNTLWNLVGQLLPMVVAVVTIPPLVRGLGVARFGVLSLAWVIIGYFSLFDLGIGRALTKLVADKMGAGEDQAIPALAWTALFLMLLMGVFGGVVTCAISPFLVYTALKIPVSLQTETLHGFYLLAISIPLVTMTSGLRGILEAQQRFRILNLIRIPMSIFSFVGPLLVLLFSHSLVPVISVLVGGRFIAYLAHQFACFRTIPALKQNFTPERALVAPLLKIGGWMMTSNLVGPAILSVDRFLISALVSVSAVAYYTAPLDMASRLLFIPSAIAGVLFPAFALSAVQDRNRTGVLLNRGVKYVFLLMFPIILIMVTLAPEILRVWLGPAFAENSAAVLRWIAAGVFINCVTVIPFALLQGLGRPDITSKVLLIELPIYLAAIWALTTHLGVRGAAIAWAGRAMLEALAFIVLSQRLLSKEMFPLKPVAIAMTVTASILCIGTLLSGPVLKSVFLVCVLLAFGFVSWFLLLTPEERWFWAHVHLRSTITPSRMTVSPTGIDA